VPPCGGTGDDPHAYGYELRWKEMKPLRENLSAVASQLTRELKTIRLKTAELEADL